MQPALTPAKLAGGAPTLWPATPGGENLDPGRPVSYGFGWFLDPDRMWHYGSTQGFRTVIERYLQPNLSVIILCNRTDLDPAALAQRVAAIVQKK